MSKVTVQDIEAVDDYWGPTFRSILEGKTVPCFVINSYDD